MDYISKLFDAVIYVMMSILGIMNILICLQ